MSRVDLQRGGNTALGAVGQPPESVVVGLSWDSGGLVCAVCALICGPERKVLSDEHFLFWDNTEAPDRSVFLRSQQDPPDPNLDRAQVLVALSDLPSEAHRIVITLSTMVEGASLRALNSLWMHVRDPGNGTEYASFETDGSALTSEACLIVGELYQYKDRWKVRAVQQGYHSGLAGLSTDFGVNLV